MKNFSRPDLQDTNFKYIQALPSGSEFIDIGLSKTQRKTPTVVKRGWPIQRIRQFYMRKIKFIRSDSHERLSKILDQFPKIDEIHPFYSDLLGLIYDKNNYKLALGRINSCRNLICKLARDHLKLLKFSDSIYRCKQLKRALFGRISKVKKKLSPSLTYLQKFRQHIALLPSIDPKKRTILLCGFPNVGKSSFMNKITRANVEVQKYPFTTKSLNLGHMEYKYQNWQIIDTPGILDRPLDERNTIEMKSITALAHLRACIVYILDVSEACGYTIKQQVALFESIKPLVSNRPLVIACNKIDCIRPEDIPSEDRNLIEKICSIDSSSIAQNNAQNIEIETPKLTYISTINGVGLMETKQIACDGLLNSRIELKLSNIENQGSANPLHITIPSHTKKINPSLPRSLEETIIDRGIYKHDNSQDRLLNSTKWQFKIPEIISGYNVFDFIHQEISTSLNTILQEEEKLSGEWRFDIINKRKDAEFSPEIEAIVEKIRECKKMNARSNSEQEESSHIIFKKHTRKINSKFLRKNSLDNKQISFANDNHVNRKSLGVETEEILKNDKTSSKRCINAQTRIKLFNKRLFLDKRKLISNKAIITGDNAQHFRSGRIGDADRSIVTIKPKHKFSGKEKLGKKSRR